MKRIVLLVFWLTLCGVAFSQAAVKVAPIPVDNGDGTFTVFAPLESTPIAPVSIVAKGAAFEAVGTLLKTTFSPDNSVKYETPDADSWVQLVPLAVMYDATPTEMAAVVAPQVTLTSSVTDGKLSIPNLFSGVPVRYESTDQSTAELLTLDQTFLSGIPKTAKVAQFVWRLTKSTDLTHITHALQGVVVGDIDTPMVLRIEPLEARDVAGGYLAGRCEYRSGFIIGTLDAAWLRAATAPVVVDPTVLAAASTAELGGGQDYPAPPWNYASNKVYVKFTLPNINGGTVTASEVRFANLGTHNDDTTLGSYISQNVTWTEGSNAATMNAIAQGTELGSTTITDAWGWWVWNVTGDASKGIVKAYADSCAEVTVILQGWVGSVAVVTAELYVQDDGPTQVWENQLQDSSRANPPQLYVTYAPGQRQPPRPAFAIQGTLSF